MSLNRVRRDEVKENQRRKLGERKGGYNNESNVDSAPEWFRIYGYALYA